MVGFPLKPSLTPTPSNSQIPVAALVVVAAAVEVQAVAAAEFAEFVPTAIPRANHRAIAMYSPTAAASPAFDWAAGALVAAVPVVARAVVVPVAGPVVAAGFGREMAATGIQRASPEVAIAEQEMEIAARAAAALGMSVARTSSRLARPL